MSGEQVPDRCGPEVLVVINENYFIVPSFRSLARQIKPAEAADVTWTVMDQHRNLGRRRCLVHPGTL